MINILWVPYIVSIWGLLLVTCSPPSKEYFDAQFVCLCVCLYILQQHELEQLERLRSEDTPRRLMITHTIESCWIPSQNKVEWPWRYRSRSKVITCDTLLMLVIICIIYGKNPSRTIDATERTRFSRSRPNDLENIGQGQRSLHATHPLMLMMICAKYGKNTSRIVDFFSRDTPSNGSDYLRQIWK